jgi:hypothetical protein
MSLVANSNNPQAADPVENSAFFPAIEPDAMRSVERIGAEITNARLVHAIAAAIADINRQLIDYRQSCIESGADSLADVPNKDWQQPGYHVLLYRRAVYATAHAHLLERYRTYSATGDTADAAELKDNSADDYRRDARWAISELTGHNHTTVELI